MANKTTKLKQAELIEHPDDKANRERCEAFSASPEGLALAKRLMTEAELWVLITTYPDGDAHDALDALRERYWMQKEIP